MTNYSQIRNFCRRGIMTLLLCMIVLAGFSFPISVDAAEQNTSGSGLVYVIPIEQTIETGLFKFMERSFEEAEAAQASTVVLAIDTLGGSVDAAFKIGELINSSSMRTIAWIRGDAISAGSYISLNADEIMMAPGSSIGAAAVVDISGQRIEDSKIIAAWVSKMRSAAEINGRNPDYAEGMVNDQKVVEVKELQRTYGVGELISFTASDALAAGYSEGTASSLNELLQQAGLNDASVIQSEPTPSEKLARVLTNPYVMTMLLLVGIAGVVIELFIPGFGIPGILGVCAFGLYFFGHFAAGFAGVEHIFMFIAGVILLAIEIFIPSFGILGILGILSLISGVILAAYDTGQASLSLGIAFIAAIIVIVIVVKYFKHRGVWNRFILKESLNTESGYISNENKAYLLGKTGKTLTSLRPSGTARIEDKRVDVVTSGEFIDAGKDIKVIHVEGTRVVVSEI